MLVTQHNASKPLLPKKRSLSAVGQYLVRRLAEFQSFASNTSDYLVSLVVYVYRHTNSCPQVRGTYIVTVDVCDIF